MTKRLKIMFCLLTTACFALFAAACGTTGSGSTSESNRTSESDSASESVAKEELEIVSPKGEVFPYAEKVIEYLDAGEDANLTDYYYLTDNAFAPIVIEWKNLPADAKSVLVEYSTDENMTSGESVTLSKDSTKLEVYNLLKATKYYVRVSAETNSGEKEIASTEFETTDLGPRMMNIGGIYNVRDLGGYLTASGERTVQGRFFRGGFSGSSILWNRPLRVLVLFAHVLPPVVFFIVAYFGLFFKTPDYFYFHILLKKRKGDFLCPYIRFNRERRFFRLHLYIRSAWRTFCFITG